jgi:hypothetical protein
MSPFAKSSPQNHSYHDTLTSEFPDKGETLVWTGLSGDSLPLAIANAVQALEGLLVVITPDMQSAELLREQYGVADCLSTYSHAAATTTGLYFKKQPATENR